MKTWGDVCDEYMECQTKEDANKFLEKEIQRIVTEQGKTPKEAETTLRSSLGYMMAYFDEETAQRMQKLLDLTHPVMPWIGKDGGR